tara:strand:- start:660 stop:767 length:108 start_codon:yes stop_codon:yes gene_type:complete
MYYQQAQRSLNKKLDKDYLLEREIGELNGTIIRPK